MKRRSAAILAFGSVCAVTTGVRADMGSRETVFVGFAADLTVGYLRLVAPEDVGGMETNVPQWGERNGVEIGGDVETIGHLGAVGYPSVAGDWQCPENGKVLSQDEASGPEVWEVPPPPGSGALALSGLAAVGVFRLLRSARHLHWGTLPEWYHDACPERIGHAVPFDFYLYPMPVSMSAPVTAGDTKPLAGSPQRRREATSRLRLQFILPVTAPRSPPSFPC